MADSKPKASRTRKPDEAEPEDAVAEAGSEGTEAVEAAGAEGDVVQSPEPPAAEDPQAAGPADAGEVPDDPGPIPVSLVLAEAESLFGVAPEVAKGVLADAPDPITIADAQARIESYLSSPVTTDEEA